MSNPTEISSLANLFSKPQVSNIWYNGKEIHLDGYTFESCRFDNCTLVVSTSNFELINCMIGQGTSFRFGPEVANPIRLFNIYNDKIYKESPFFAPIKNQDGTITIKANNGQ